MTDLEEESKERKRNIKQVGQIEKNDQYKSNYIGNYIKCKYAKIFR